MACRSRGFWKQEGAGCKDGFWLLTKTDLAEFIS